MVSILNCYFLLCACSFLSKDTNWIFWRYNWTSRTSCTFLNLWLVETFRAKNNFFAKFFIPLIKYIQIVISMTSALWKLLYGNFSLKYFIFSNLITLLKQHIQPGQRYQSQLYWHWSHNRCRCHHSMYPMSWRWMYGCWYVSHLSFYHWLNWPFPWSGNNKKPKGTNSRLVFLFFFCLTPLQRLSSLILSSWRLVSVHVRTWYIGTIACVRTWYKRKEVDYHASGKGSAEQKRKTWRH